MAKAKNSKGLFRRGKIWWIRYTVNGSQTRESSASALKADAEYLLATRIKAIGEGIAPPVANQRVKNTTFAELCKLYLEFIQGQKALATKKGFIQELKAEFGAVKLNALTLAAVESWQARLMNQPRQARSEAKKKEVLAPLAVASVNRRLACLKHMLTKAVDWELIGKDTLDRFRRVKLTKEENRRSRFLSAAECRDLIAAAPKHLKPILIFALNTGCRKGEILGLTWDRVDLKHGFIRLDKTKSGTGRDIPINNTLAAMLQGLIRRVDSPLVFYNPASGGQWHDLKRPFATSCSKAKLQNFRFHDLRHTFASQLVMAGIDLTTVSRLLGHASLTMTLRYSHLAPDHLKSAVDVLNRLQDAPLEEKRAAH